MPAAGWHSRSLPLHYCIRPRIEEGHHWPWRGRYGLWLCQRHCAHLKHRRASSRAPAGSWKGTPKSGTSAELKENQGLGLQHWRHSRVHQQWRDPHSGGRLQVPQCLNLILPEGPQDKKGNRLEGAARHLENVEVWAQQDNEARPLHLPLSNPSCCMGQKHGHSLLPMRSLWMGVNTRMLHMAQDVLWMEHMNNCWPLRWSTAGDHRDRGLPAIVCSSWPHYFKTCPPYGYYA